ncbi:hypothetical protein NDU88_008729 [Pleurodeles waltl]|uniref:Urotensin-2 n=1 Tax=Pleurodeles waltl TaxID=8319 RepID=A0AAV7QRI5_PLEWA|nr:hypothetical protein NDU88_008729 [Pleurodeles waltl]
MLCVALQPRSSIVVELYSGTKLGAEDSRPDLEEANNLDRTYLLQSLPVFMDKHNFDTKADDVLIKDDATQIGYNPSDNLNEAFYGKRPRNVLLSRLLSKERKQYKKRGNLSECFWKYCV